MYEKEKFSVVFSTDDGCRLVLRGAVAKKKKLLTTDRQNRKQKRKLKDQKREDTLCGDCILNQSSGTQRTTLNLYQMRFVSRYLKVSPYQHPMALNQVSQKNGMFQKTEKHTHSI